MHFFSSDRRIRAATSCTDSGGTERTGLSGRDVSFRRPAGMEAHRQSRPHGARFKERVCGPPKKTPVKRPPGPFLHRGTHYRASPVNREARNIQTVSPRRTPVQRRPERSVDAVSRMERKCRPIISPTENPGRGPGFSLLNFRKNYLIFTAVAKPVAMACSIVATFAQSPMDA